MTRQVTVLKVFVASPGDVEEERNHLEDVVRDLNLEWKDPFGIQLELVKWETHAYPDFGEDAQSIITRQIAQDFDIFIGIMWYTAGTHTPRAESGTIEEFRWAKRRYDEDSRSVRMMFYFKDAPISPSMVDPGQLQTVAEFRSSLGKEGGLYWTFKTVSDFEKLVRRHLVYQVQEWRKQQEEGLRQTAQVNERQVTESSSQGVDSDTVEEIEEELGLLDLEEMIEDEFSSLSEVIRRIGDATQEMGMEINSRTEEISQIDQTGPGSIARKALRRVITKAAANMDKYVSRMDAELPLFSKHLNEGMTGFTKVVPILGSLHQEDNTDEARDRIRDTVKQLREPMAGAETKCRNFRFAISSLPSMTTEMNRARRATMRVLQQQIEGFRGAQLALTEVENMLDNDFEE